MSSRGLVVGALVGIAISWNTTNVGAIAADTADAYGIALATVGLFTTALFVTHLLAQVPGGRLVDRFGARQVCFLGVGIVALGASFSMVSPSLPIGIAARTLTGVGTGLGFIGGSAYVRRTGGTAFAQGIYGGIGLGAGGLAIAIVPAFVPLVSWRAPYGTALALTAVALAALAVGPRDSVESPPSTGARKSPAAVFSDSRLRRLGLLYSVSFGVTLALSNWIAELLERHGMSAEAGVVGSLILLAGVITRPLGGWVYRHHPRRIRSVLAASLAMGAAGSALLGIADAVPVAVVGCLLLGIGGGIPFSPAFTGAAAIRPDAPGAAVGFVNAMAAATVLVCTPLVGLGFSFAGDGRLGFAIASLAWLVALATLSSRGTFGGSEARPGGTLAPLANVGRCSAPRSPSP